MVQPKSRVSLELNACIIAALSMMQTLLLSALSVAREREQGTFDQLLVTPYTPLQIMIGKAFADFCRLDAIDHYFIDYFVLV